MLEKLTPEQEELMYEVRDYWINKLFSCKNRVAPKEKLQPYIDWLYSLAGYESPEIIVVGSPMAVQEEVFKLKGKREPESFASNGNVWDYDWVAFYDFFTQIGVINYDQFNKYKELMELHIYDMVQLEGYCIISDMPVEIYREPVNQRLHRSDGPAVVFPDGYEQFHWNGVAVPREWIMEPETITAETIRGEENAEKRRILMEIIGAEAYYEKLGGVELVDEDLDAYGKPMKLYRSKEVDKIINDYVYFLSVVDTSTDRIYNLYPNVRDFPDAKTNVYSAKASTFNKTKEEFYVVEES